MVLKWLLILNHNFHHWIIEIVDDDQYVNLKIQLHS